MYREKEVASEAEAIAETAVIKAGGAIDSENTQRRIHDWAVVDSKGNGEPLESLAFLQQQKKKVFLSGVVYPHSARETSIQKEQGRRVEEPFGPVVGYTIDLKASSITIQTAKAMYTVMRPAQGYKKWFDHLSGQVSIASDVFAAISSSDDVQNIHMDNIIAHLARSKVCAKEYGSSREGLLVNGAFVLEHLKATNDGLVASCPFYDELKSEVEAYKYAGVGGGHPARELKIKQSDGGSGGVEDMDAEPLSTQELADQQFAMQLQAKMDCEMNGHHAGFVASKKETQAYIKVNEEEIAGEYPLPTQYVKLEEEMDEFLLYDEALEVLAPEDLPKRTLTDYAIYNADGFLMPLELLPMWSGIDPDVELYASGVVMDQGMDEMVAASDVVEEVEQEADVGAVGGSGSSGCKAAAKTEAEEPQGTRMSLSQIREWVVELGPDMVFISLRTDIGWYSLSKPALRYKPWNDVILKCAHVAASTLQMICEESRASKLSFNDIVKKICAEPADSKTYISSKSANVQRFLSVHAQIFLSCYQHFPMESVRKCAFVLALREKLNSVKHSKLYVSVPKGRGRTNRNPMKDRAAGSRSKPMTATATAMVKAVWQSYFVNAATLLAAAQKAQEANKANDTVAGTVGGNEKSVDDEVPPTTPIAKLVEEDENEEVDEAADATETALAEHKDERIPDVLLLADPVPKNANKNASWEISEKKDTAAVGKAFSIALGDCVMACSPNTDVSVIGIAQCFYERKNRKLVQVRVLKQGCDTVLGDAASDEELFLTMEVQSFELSQVKGKLDAKQRQRSWDLSKRMEYFAEDTALRQKNALVKTSHEGALEMFWSKEYVPEEGMFRDISSDVSDPSKLGKLLKEVSTSSNATKVAVSDSDDEEPLATATEDGVIIDGTEYKVGQFIFVGPDVFDQMPEAVRDLEVPSYLKNSRHHKGSHEGLRAWGIGRIVKVGGPKTKTCIASGEEVSSITVQRFWRPEDISVDLADQASSYYALYASAGKDEVKVEVDEVVGPVTVGSVAHDGAEDIFFCVGTFDKKTKKVTGAEEVDKELAETAVAKDAKAEAATAAASGEHLKPDSISLATMDIFAGCGGLSEGMHQARAAETKWAIEYEQPAAEAFKLNNPDAAVFCNNCNVLLHAAMVKAGQEGYCEASQEAIDASNALPATDKERLPVPGEVDFICGGPPCQGYSGMNRFNKGNWSMVQNSMVMAYLSYCDFYRPRYFLLENVRNFVSHNKSFTFRLTLRSLLDMGYQVRFGVLNAGNFGVAQSRKRTFIWAAAPDEGLPSWPRLLHRFRTPQLTINLPGGVQYRAVPQTDGAPLRPVTVMDSIGDLPAIENGHTGEVSKYTKPPASAFQKAIRGDCEVLYDHECKYMNEINLQRCRCIPAWKSTSVGVPGADWRTLEEVVAKDPSKKIFMGQPLVPWCLPNTADRHNGWRGLYGRLDPMGSFGTATTDPQPMGKVGTVLHPSQDRIISVRECARSQGFPDKFRFYGNPVQKHRQVGNAVPPVLAAKLGEQLRLVLEQTDKKKNQSLLDAMLF